MIDLLIDVTLLTFLAVSAVAIIRLRNLFAVIMLFGIFSLLSAGLFVVMDAADVAFTEAAVGAGISTVLMLATLALTDGHNTELPPFHRPWLPLLVVVVTGAALIYGTWDTAHFGDSERACPASCGARLSDPRTGRDRNAQRGDVGACQLSGLRHPRGGHGDLYGGNRGAAAARQAFPGPGRRGGGTLKGNLVLRVVSKFLIPLIILFAFYVQFHGDFGPGGGFQAGVIFASAFILYALVFGLDAARRVTPPAVLRLFASCGVLLYAGTGVASLMAGGAFLDYSRLASDPVAGQHLGILLIELGVGITVASVMLLIFYSFAGWHAGK